MEYYDILGLDKHATESQIKKAYYKLARENHPDKTAESERGVATQEFQKIGEAYEVLSDPEKRKLYDAYGKEGLQQGQQGQNGPPVDPFSMFSQMFGGQGFGGFSQGFPQGFGGSSFSQSFNRQDPGPRKNKETVFPLNLTLTQVYTGFVKKLKVSRKVVINKATKEKIDVSEYENTWKKCEQCGGQGMVMQRQQVAPNMFTQTQSPCNICSGKGFCYLEDYILEDVSEIIKVQVEKGVPNGFQILFKNLGNSSAGFLPGDLIIVLNCASEEKEFVREKNNLIYQKNIDLVDSLCGFSYEIITLDDRKLQITSTEVIAPGDQKTIYKEGLNGGNLIIIFDVVFPTNIRNPDKLRKLLKN